MEDVSSKDVTPIVRVASDRDLTVASTNEADNTVKEDNVHNRCGGLTVTPLFNAVSVTTSAAVDSILTEPQLNDTHKKALQAVDFYDYKKPAEIVIQDNQENLPYNSRELSAESGGTRLLRSIHGTYLRAYKEENEVDMAPAPAKEWECWYIEDWKGKVVFKAIHSPGKFLRALPGGSVDLVMSHPQGHPEQQWVPFKNSDESWSFMSCYGQWLSARENGKVYTVAKNRAWEHFCLEWWH